MIINFRAKKTVLVAESITTGSRKGYIAYKRDKGIGITSGNESYGEFLRLLSIDPEYSILRNYMVR